MQSYKSNQKQQPSCKFCQFSNLNAQISKTIQYIKFSSTYLESAANFTSDRSVFVILEIFSKNNKFTAFGAELLLQVKATILKVCQF